jgi:adenylyl-sulfate kinase
MSDSPRHSSNITWHGGEVTPIDRAKLLGQSGCVIWLTGLSGSGKSTIARRLEQSLIGGGRLAYVLDGDNVRHGLNGDLGFTPDDRQENIRRLAEIAALFADAGLLTVTAFISPYRRDRQLARDKAGPGRFVEVYIDTPLDVCEQRDPKGLYKKARAGKIEQFTGIDAPYEPPEMPDITVKTAGRDVDECTNDIIAALAGRSLLQPPLESP